MKTKITEQEKEYSRNKLEGFRENQISLVENKEENSNYTIKGLTGFKSSKISFVFPLFLVLFGGQD